MNLIIDENINPWINSLEDIDQQKYLNNLLNIGYMISTQVTIKPNNEYTETILNLHNKNNEQCINTGLKHVEKTIKEMSERMSSIETRTTSTVENSNQKMLDIVEKFTGKTKTSSSRGAIGENFIETELEKTFLNDTIVRSSGDAHEADFKLISTDSENIIFEIKTYTSVVATKEIDKFKQDMIRTNYRFGIFVSFNSKVTGKKNMEIEQFNDGMYILYISNTGFDMEFIALGVNIFKRISNLFKDNLSAIPRNLVKDKINNIIQSINKLPDVLSYLTKAKSVLISEGQNIRYSLDSIHSEFLKTEVMVKQVIDEIRKEVDYKISCLEAIDGGAIKDIEILLEHVDSKKQTQVRTILEQHLLHNYIIEYDTDGFNIKKNAIDNIISRLTTKSKIKLHITSMNIDFDMSKKCISSLETYFDILEKI